MYRLESYAPIPELAICSASVLKGQALVEALRSSMGKAMRLPVLRLYQCAFAIRREMMTIPFVPRKVLFDWLHEDWRSVPEMIEFMDRRSLVDTLVFSFIEETTLGPLLRDEKADLYFSRLKSFTICKYYKKTARGCVFVCDLDTLFFHLVRTHLYRVRTSKDLRSKNSYNDLFLTLT